MVDLVKGMYNAVRRQGYEAAYILQTIPILGAVISVPTAVVSCIHAIVKFVQSIFQNLWEGKPFFRPADKSMDGVDFPFEDALDLSLIFANNVANICTFSIVNCIFTWSALTQAIANKGRGDY